MRMQKQLRVLEEKKAKLRPSNGPQVEIATFPLFDREASKVGEFVMVSKL